MARWALCWLFVIALATVCAYVGTNEFVARQRDDGYAMRLLGARLGSPVCSQATRELVAAGAGADYDRAARNVLLACSDV